MRVGVGVRDLSFVDALVPVHVGGVAVEHEGVGGGVGRVEARGLALVLVLVWVVSGGVDLLGRGGVEA